MGKYRILSFDGGGMKGALSIKAFEMLTNEIPELLNNVNLIAGTSTGGLIALGLGAGKSPSDISQLYATKGADIFDPYKLFGNSSNPDDVSVKATTEEHPEIHFMSFNPKDIIFPQYNNKKFKVILDELFKDTPTLKTLKKNVIVTTFQVNNPKGWEPVLISNLKDSNCIDSLCTDAALCTSAAPTYFPLYNGYADGGVFANNPSMVAVSAALDKAKVGVEMEDICLLSFGTGATITYKDAKQGSEPWGILQWLNPYGTSGNDPQTPLLGILMEGANIMTHYQCAQLFGAKQYNRFDIPLDKAYEMDDWKDVNYLFERVENYPKTNPREWNELLSWVKEFFL